LAKAIGFANVDRAGIMLNDCYSRGGADIFAKRFQNKTFSRRKLDHFFENR